MSKLCCRTGPSRQHGNDCKVRSY